MINRVYQPFCQLYFELNFDSYFNETLDIAELLVDR